ncbi:hypothetical protein CFD26_101576 [Aspergillus turcosus]|uniref:aldehyde dehydrogenase (NAD(+)) n=1 Tax=Aspergillus turcosus TaxID=1245748 RepID=A0A3R7F0V9_9EURO|nr:hypothetical protein CFD26_101576 [Aspergillus turcosus]
MPVRSLLDTLASILFFRKARVTRVLVFHNVINGALAPTTKTRHSINPANRQPNPEVPVATQDDLDQAVTAAQAAFREWRRVPLEERRAALHKYADALEGEKDGFTKLLTQEQGKPLSQAADEINRAVSGIRALSSLELPETVLEDTPERRIVQRFTPLGVAAAIVPWNFPVLLAIGKIVSALITGNSIIVKPSPFTPYCALKLAELAIPFFPKGLFQALSGDDSLGPLITAHPGIHKVSFTRSTATGKRVAAACAESLKHCTLELGGNDAAIVTEDVDVDQVVQKVCMMIKRLYVHEAIYDEFRDKLVSIVKTFPLGEGTKPDVFFGPIQNEMQYNKARDLLASISSEGLTTVLGGSPGDPAGFFIQPTIVDNPPGKARVVIEEPFAPILPLLKWRADDEVLDRANTDPSGLGGSVWCRDPDRAQRLADCLDTGSVWINSHLALAPHVPYGGHKQSGIGVEYGLEGLKAYCASQTVWLFKDA